MLSMEKSLPRNKISAGVRVHTKGKWSEELIAVNVAGSPVVCCASVIRENHIEIKLTEHLKQNIREANTHCENE